MSNRKKKETIGVIKGVDVLKKTRGIQNIPFKTGKHMSEKDRPRDNNWRKWKEDEY